MSGDSPEAIRKHAKVYWVIFGTLMVLTVLTVAASKLDVPMPTAVAIALVIACIKGGLVAGYVFLAL